jgi:hypothetical protein
VDFSEIIRKSRPEGEDPFSGILLSFDPGHTTGWCVFEGTELQDFGQLDTRNQDESVHRFLWMLETWQPDICVFEDYRVYAWRAKEHANSELHTTKLIGIIQSACVMRQIPYYKQPAHVAKQFVPDERLLEWGYYDRTSGQRHARDAIRHACYYIAFGDRSQWHRIKRKPPRVG